MLLDERKKKILQAIVESYIKSCEPVGSKTLEKNYSFNVSSATLRNEMAELEEMGYIDKPHISSGRVPSDKGYRLYVDELMNHEKLTDTEIDNINKKIFNSRFEIESLIKDASNILAEITNTAVIAVTPKFDDLNIEDIKIMYVSQGILMVIVITGRNVIKDFIIKTDRSVEPQDLNQINDLFNKIFVGKTLSEIDNLVHCRTDENYYDIIDCIFNQINKKIMETEKQYYLEGTKNIFNIPEFNDFEKTKNFFEVIEDKSIFEKIFNSKKDSINIMIGEENNIEKLKDFSVITFNFSVGNQNIGSIGIVGPTRMNYSKAISTMKNIESKINEQFDK